MVFISFYPDYVPSFWRLRIHLFRFLFTLVNSAAGWFYVNGQEHKSYSSKMLNPSLLPGWCQGSDPVPLFLMPVKNGFPSVCHNKGTQSQAWLSAFFFGFKTYIETKTFYFYIFVVFFFFLFLNYHKILFIFISTPSFFFLLSFSFDPFLYLASS